MLRSRKLLSCVMLWVLGLSGAGDGPAVAQPWRGGKPGGVLMPGRQGVIEAESPLSLTASDGSGLSLVSLRARAVVEDPLAFTELALTFENPENRQREGRFRITLPPGATISRFAMKIGNDWMEGEVVERQAARRAYEDFLHRRQDPALLENEAGNEFSARIFPIPPRGRKELIVAYSQELPRKGDAYRLPLLGLPMLGELDVRVLVGSEAQGGGGPASNLGGSTVRQQIIELHKRNFTPDQDLVINDRGATRRAGLRHDNLVVARVVPVSGSSAPQAIRSLLVLFDTSASRALGFGEQVARLQQLIETLRKDPRNGDFGLQVVAFDQDIKPFYQGRAGGYGDDDSARMRDRRAEGASDLAGALTDVVSRYSSRSQFDRVLLVSDGAATAGSTDGDKLRAAARALATIGVHRLDVLAAGGIRDDEKLAALARAGGSEASGGVVMNAGVVVPPDVEVAEAARRLTLATRAGLKVAIPGAAWVWPSVLDGVQAGDEILIYADVPAGKPVRATVDGQVVLSDKDTLTLVEQPLLERAWVKARLSRLAEQRDTLAAGDKDLRAALRTQMIELSTKYRVLCDDTALLVLETEADYARFHIDRRALADILTVGPGGIDVVARTGVAIARNAPPTGPAKAKTSLRSGALSADPLPDLFAPGNAPAPPADQAPAESQEKDLADGDSEAKKEARDDRGQAQGLAGLSVTGTSSVGGGVAEGAGSLGRSARAPASPSMAAPRPAPASAPRPQAEPSLAAADEAVAERQEAPSAGIRETTPRRMRAPAQTESAQRGPAPLTGDLAAIMKLIRNGDAKAAFAQALAWRTRDAGDVLAIVGLGEASLAMGDKEQAARVFGSIIDLFPSRADFRRFAAGHLERLRTPTALALAVDALEKTVEQRPDHPSSHHLLALALLKAGQPDRAFAAIEAALKQNYPDGRFAGADRILREDLGLCAAAWSRKEPGRSNEINARLRAAGGSAERNPSLRFVLSWETDANDVDFHIHDARGGHAFYSTPSLPSGGDLYADVTTGYGPECFTIRGAASRRAAPYKLQAHYYSKGPMGYGMGRLEIVDHDGKGELRFESRPFVVMTDGAFLDLGGWKQGGGGNAIAKQPGGQVLAPVR